MQIIVKAKTNAKKESVERITQATQDLLGKSTPPDTYKVSVKEPPVDGKANKAIIQTLAKHFNTAPSYIRIISGLTSKTKIVEIETREE